MKEKIKKCKNELNTAEKIKKMKLEREKEVNVINDYWKRERGQCN